MILSVSMTSLGSAFFVGGDSGLVSGFSISGPFSERVTVFEPNVEEAKPARDRNSRPLVCEKPPPNPS
jgi:hypothetical protein